MKPIAFAELSLFSGTSQAECARMMDCFHAPLRTFHANEVIHTYGVGETVGVLHSGRAQIVKIDLNGGRTVLERLENGGVFGEWIAFSSLPCDSVTVVAETPCTVLFIPPKKLTCTCEKACECHRILIENMLTLISKKAFALSERIEVLSCRSIREKLLCCFRIFAAQRGEPHFTLPFSLSALADYICSDRSAMMRELKKLRVEGFLDIQGRHIRFLPSGSQPVDVCASSI